MSARRERAPRKTRRRGNATTARMLAAWNKTPAGCEHHERLNEMTRRRWKTAARCGALAKGTGESCKQLAMENGRCRWHGGLTPKGREWHRVQAAPSGREAQKLDTIERRVKARARRLRKMTPEELERHEAWQRSHKPGPAARRAADRKQRRDNLEARAYFEAAGIIAPRAERPAEASEKTAPQRGAAGPLAAAEGPEAYRGTPEGQRQLSGAPTGAAEVGRPEPVAPGPAARRDILSIFG